MRLGWIAAAALFAAAPAFAQADDPRFCPNRPGLGASGCTTEPGQVQVELAGVDWELDRTPEERIDTIRYADTTARIGLGPHTEVQLGWSPLVTQRTRDHATGMVSRITGVSDLTIAVRQNLTGADGKGLSTAIQPFVVLPTGRDGIGDGDWSAGAVIPVAYDITDKWNLGLTSQIAAQADEDGHGRHFDASAVVEASYALTDAVTAFGDVAVERDDDPMAHVTRARVAGALAWQPTKRTQLDLLAVTGLNRNTPDLELALGGAFLL